MAVVYLALGSNLGDRKANLNEATRRLCETPGVTCLRVSSHVRTEPWGVTDQPEFLNGAVAVETSLPPEVLLRVVKAIERDMGRQPGPRWGPRLIDIDLLWYDGLSLETADLTLPHPEMMNRPFVREPLREIAPDLFAALSGNASVPPKDPRDEE
jgi:2-amino-4-hydroxy-6-hydroxymethyldihydropteridine diphosphokinase